MNITFDPAKDSVNQEKHGISLALADEFDFTTALVMVDERNDYGELREVAVGYLDGRLHVLVYTIRDQQRRAISLRKANKREEMLYAEKTR